MPASTTGHNQTQHSGQTGEGSPAKVPSGKQRLLIVTALTFTVSVLLGITSVVIIENSRLQARQKTVRDITVRIGENIHDHLSRSLSATYALAALVRQGNGQIERFDQLATEMLSLYGGISSLQLAPDGILRQIAPLAGNEKAIGLNLLKDAERSHEALMAIKARGLSLAGPFELIQGGQAVVGRLPVFLKKPDGSDYFWGLVAVAIRIQDFTAVTKMQQSVDAGYHYELSRIRPDTGVRDIFARSAATPLASPVNYTITVPNGSWTLSIEPKTGWYSLPTIVAESCLVIFISVLITLLLRTLYKQPQELKQQVLERTQQLSSMNRNLTEQIEERKLAEKALLTSETRYRTLFNNVPLGISLIDNEHRIIMVNRTQCEWFNRTPESFVGQHCYEQFEKREQICSHCPGSISMKSGLPAQVETEAIRNDGSRFSASVHTVPVFNDQGSVAGFIEVVEDITVRKQAEDALRTSEARLIESQKVAKIGHYEFDAASGMWVSSRELDNIFGIDEYFVRDTQGWLTIVHPEQRDEMANFFAHDVLENRRPFDREYRIQRISDQAERWVYGLGELEYDTLGRPVKMFGTIQDITERKRVEAERIKLEQQMQHAQKLESLGVLAGGIAHDFNNILMSILGHAELAMLRLSPVAPARENLANIEIAAQRAADLARQMLAYSGKGRFVLENIDLGELVTEMLHMLEISISKNVVLRLNMADGLPPVQIDATQIRQVVMNLVINASEAIGEKSGVIAISTGAARCDSDYLSSVWLDDGLPEGLYVFLEVADTGCGMDRETVSKIFDPFFTTKFTGRGLGMAAVLGIVRGHRGAIKIYSESGHGTTFKVFLPAVSGVANSIDHGNEENQLWHGTGTVLLVDDEETIRSLGVEMLEILGFKVLTADNGRTAMNVFSEHHQHIDCVVLDLTMPHMDGEETFRELRRLKPDVRVVISSGYNEQEVSQRFLGKGLTGFIQKPYKLKSLSLALKNALDGRSSA